MGRKNKIFRNSSSQKHENLEISLGGREGGGENFASSAVFPRRFEEGMEEGEGRGEKEASSQVIE